MLKKLLFNVLLKRGASAVEEVIGKTVRHGMTTMGGALMADGLADANDVTLLTGGAIALVGIAISYIRIKVQGKLG